MWAGVFTFSFMHSPQIDTTESARLPLAMPEELWASLSPAQRAVYRRAEALLDIFSFERQVSLSRLLSQGPQAEVLRALQVLGSMSLVDIEEDDDDASVTLRGVSTGDQIEIEVRLEGSGARVESENRHRREGNGEDDDEDDDENEAVRTLPDSTIKVEGAALSLSGTCPTLTFGLASKIVKTNSSTIFDDIRCSSITNMTRLEVLGRPQGDGTILATKVERED